MDHIFFDGAFGTYYFSLTGKDDMCEKANIDDPNIVRKIHSEYIKAGANAIKTNTFCTNSMTFGADLHKVISAAYSIANDASDGKSVSVFADIGNIDSDAAAELYIEVVRHFISVGANNFLFETLNEFVPITGAIKLIRENVQGATIAVSFAVKQDGYTKTGRYYMDLLNAAAGVADIVGLNCLCGPSRMAELLKNVSGISVPLLAMPNSGYPSMANNRLLYRDNPEYFASKISELAGYGVKYLGGCCGTTPEHIRLAVQAVRTAELHTSAAPENTAKDTLPEITTSRIKSLLDCKKRPVFVELDPPLSPTGHDFSAAASIYAACGADVITVPDSPFARTRADSVIMASKVSRETGLAVLPHITCRDKNSIAIQGSLLAASIEGITDLLLISGDPIPTSVGRSENVFSFNSMRLIDYVSTQNKKTFCNAPFFVAAALNTNTQNFDVELDRAKKKQEAGADYFLTQAIFSEECVQRVRRASEELGCPIIAGIMPLGSYKNALFLNNEVHGFHLPEELMYRLSKAENFDREIVSFCCEITEQLAPHCAGFYIIPQLRRTDLASSIVKYIKERI